MGILYGNDNRIVGKTYYVFDGECLPLVFELEEKQWLKNIWNKYSKNKSAYIDLNTVIESNKENTYLSNNYCPLCLKQQESFEGHHCIPSSEGGSDDVVNKLLICNSCHALVTKGCSKDKVPRYLSAIYHQVFVYGIDFYKMNPDNNKRFKNKDMGLYEFRPHIKEALNYYESLDDNEKTKYNQNLKESSLYHYKYHRGIIRDYIKENK
ncbi:MAG: HNH endonuclease [Methanofastidiosum sp.]|jgi:hypothetical protein